MTRLKTFNHVAAGVLQSFMSRNNDVGGLWAFGVLYGEARAPDHAVRLNLLGGSAVPLAPGAAQVACAYAAFLQRALLAKGTGLDELEEARVDIEFNAQLQHRSFDRYCEGDPFICTVTLRTVQGKEAVTRAVGRCVRKRLGSSERRAGD